jgi:integral membrane protein
MPAGPRPSDVPRLRTALKVYRVSAAITGTFLLLLVVMMVLRYGFLVDIELGGPFGFLALTPKDDITAINLSLVILTVHGWLYVLYLACDFIMWRLARYSFGRFLFIALGGIIPFLSYYFEFQVPPYIEARIRATTEADAAPAAKEVSA